MSGCSVGLVCAGIFGNFGVSDGFLFRVFFLEFFDFAGLLLVLACSGLGFACFGYFGV